MLEWAQRLAWGGGGNILTAAQHVSAAHHLGVLLVAGISTGLGQFALHRLTAGNGIDTTEAIAFEYGRMLLAALVAWIALPNAATYRIPATGAGQAQRLPAQSHREVDYWYPRHRVHW